jgi:hypothetical protein
MGCGGGDRPLANGGSVRLGITWAADGAAGVVPRQVSIEARLLDANLNPLRQLGAPVINRPLGDCEFPVVPPGQYVLEGRGFSQPNAGGPVNTLSQTPLTVLSGRTSQILLTFGGVPHALGVWPDPLRLTPGQQRSVVTTVRTLNGETLMIGGLPHPFEYRLLQGAPDLTVDPLGRVGAVPVLTNLPLVGRLFTQHKESQLRRELLVLVTPRLVDGDDQALPAGLTGP